jgi:hypothetical protein
MENLADVLDSMNGWRLLGLIVALGAISMAVLQLFVDLTPVRSAFHAYRLRQWLNHRVKLYNEKQYAEKKLPPIDCHEALAQLIAHATGGNSRAFLGLAPPQLVAQTNAAAQAALENPKANFSLLAVLSQPTKPQVPFILRRSQTANSDMHFDDLWSLLHPPKEESSAMKGYLEARTRTVHQIQRNLDGMLITLGNQSFFFNQILAIMISLVIAYSVVRTALPNSPASIYLIFIFGISGGYAAPIFGDIVAAIRKLGRP